MSIVVDGALGLIDLPRIQADSTVAILTVTGRPAKEKRQPEGFQTAAAVLMLMTLGFHSTPLLSPAIRGPRSAISPQAQKPGKTAFVCVCVVTF